MFTPETYDCLERQGVGQQVRALVRAAEAGSVDVEIDICVDAPVGWVRVFGVVETRSVRANLLLRAPLRALLLHGQGGRRHSTAQRRGKPLSESPSAY